MSDAKSKTAVSTVGYSGKSLWQKLGLKAQQRVSLYKAPPQYWDWCGFDVASVALISGKTRTFDFAHLFVTARSELARELSNSIAAMDANGMLWISWPKKSSGVVTDISENTLRELALPLGLVDVKVCAVTDVWSGLKFVWRIERRARPVPPKRKSR